MMLRAYLALVFCMYLNISLVSTSLCPDGHNDDIDYGDLSKPGSGRALQVRGNDFYIDNNKVFLSGLTTAWVHHGVDFGDNRYSQRFEIFECYLRKVHNAGGNMMRTFIHASPYHTPYFNNSGHVIGIDHQGTLIRDLKTYLRAAAYYNIVVFLTLWEIVPHNWKMNALFQAPVVLQEYIDLVLTPLVKELKDEPGLGGYEIAHNFESIVIKGMVNPDACYDTRLWTPGGKSSESEPIQSILRFISRQADAIRLVDPSIPITAGSAGMKFNTDSMGGVNYHKDSCLVEAGGRPLGYLSFYSTESRDEYRQDTWDPFVHNASDYQLRKPLVIGAFSKISARNMTSSEIFKWIYNHGYSGVWSLNENLDRDTNHLDILAGMEAIRSENGSNGLVKFSLSKYAIKNNLA